MSSPYPIFGTQDLKDDDAQVIDSFFVETDAPPDLTKAAEPIPVLEAPPIPAYPTRIRSGFQVLFANFEPFSLFPEDPNRLSVYFRITSLNATPNNSQYVYIAGEKTLVMPSDVAASSGMAYRARHGHDLTLIDHTGSIWIGGNPNIATEGIEISWILVSKQK